MEDIGRHPDSGKPSEYEHEYEIRYSDESTCPWCEEDLRLDLDIIELLMLGFKESFCEMDCWSCSAALNISLSLMYREEPPSAEVVFEVAATKRIA